MDKVRPYSISPLTENFGGIISDLQIADVSDSDTSVIDSIREDLTEYRLLLFKNQGKLSAENQLRASRWFGEIHSTFYKHPKSPHPEIFRVSNDERQGCLQVGRSGWHIDGTFIPRPFRVQTMHFWEVSEGGDTWFAPSAEVIESLGSEERELFESLYFVTRDNLPHPLIYTHPRNNRPTFVIHCGKPFVGAFAKNFNPEKRTADILKPEETERIRKRLGELFEDSRWMHAMQWEKGDFAILDNLALVHYASEGTQNRPKQSGLRILHRTTVQGMDVPLRIKLDGT